MIAGLVAVCELGRAWREDRPLADAIAGLPDIARADRARPRYAGEAPECPQRPSCSARGATLAIRCRGCAETQGDLAAIHAEAYSAAEVLHGPADL